MKNTPLLSIKIAAYAFLILGALTVPSIILNLTVDKTTPSNGWFGGNMGDPLNNIFFFSIGVLHFLVGWFLLRQKRFAYISALILAGVPNILILFSSATAKQKYFVLLFWAAILILLIVGRKNFMKDLKI